MSKDIGLISITVSNDNLYGGANGDSLTNNTTSSSNNIVLGGGLEKRRGHVKHKELF
ncbi:hypothetical protein N9K77_00665 [bacterium]|nr:hypothetical protein [bacterium]